MSAGPLDEHWLFFCDVRPYLRSWQIIISNCKALLEGKLLKKNTAKVDSSEATTEQEEEQELQSFLSRVRVLGKMEHYDAGVACLCFPKKDLPQKKDAFAKSLTVGIPAAGACTATVAYHQFGFQQFNGIERPLIGRHIQCHRNGSAAGFHRG